MCVCVCVCTCIHKPLNKIMYLQLKVREHPTMGPYVEELSSYVVESFDDVNVRRANY